MIKLCDTAPSSKQQFRLGNLIGCVVASTELSTAGRIEMTGSWPRIITAVGPGNFQRLVRQPRIENGY